MRLLAPFVLCAIALVVTVLLDDAPPRSNVIFINRGDVFTLDPQRMSYMQDLRMASALYEGLVRFDNRDATVVPGVASDWSISDDGLVYTFHLRDDARWSNGDPVTAGDFVYAWRRAIMPDTAANYSGMFFMIEGAEDMFHARARMTADFVADPATGDRRALSAAARRLRQLLEVRPEGLDFGVAAEREQLARELEAVERDRAVVADVPNVLAALAWLDTPERRRLEATWMRARSERMFDETVGITAPDPRTLVVRLHRPVAYALDLLAFAVFSPVHATTVEQYVDLVPDTGRIEQRHDWTRPGRLVGNGPYVLTHWRYKRDMRVERNEHYWNRDAVRSRSLTAVSMDDPNTAVLAFESGSADWVTDVTVEYRADMVAERTRYLERHADRFAALRAEGRTVDEALAALPPPGRGERRNIHVLPSFGTDFFGFNCRPVLVDGTPNPFSNPLVRRAFVRAVDRQAIVERVTRMREPVATTFVPPGSIPGYRSPGGLGHDPEAAREALAAAGWIDRDGDGRVEDVNGVPFPVVDLLYSTGTPRYRDLSLALRDMWQRELGVAVELRGKDTKFYRDDRKKGNFMICRGGWYGDYGDPTTFLDLCRTGDGNNHRGYSNPAFDALLDRAADELDTRKRLDLLHDAEAIIMDEDVPLLVLCTFVTVYMYEPGELRGLTHHPRLDQHLDLLERVEP
jgi:ABC-type oligopeptide transport system substrate-binding subunit